MFLFHSFFALLGWDVSISFVLCSSGLEYCNFFSLCSSRLECFCFILFFASRLLLLSTLIFQERENLNIQIVRAINLASEAWGIQSMRWTHYLHYLLLQCILLLTTSVHTLSPTNSHLLLILHSPILTQMLLSLLNTTYTVCSPRYEIRDIKLPSRVQEAMQMQVEAERKKRAAVLESEGIKVQLLILLLLLPSPGCRYQHRRGPEAVSDPSLGGRESPAD